MLTLSDRASAAEFVFKRDGNTFRLEFDIDDIVPGTVKEFSDGVAAVNDNGGELKFVAVEGDGSAIYDYLTIYVAVDGREIYTGTLSEATGHVSDCPDGELTVRISMDIDTPNEAQGMTGQFAIELNGMKPEGVMYLDERLVLIICIALVVALMVIAIAILIKGVKGNVRAGSYADMTVEIDGKVYELKERTQTVARHKVARSTVNDIDYTVYPRGTVRLFAGEGAPGSSPMNPKPASNGCPYELPYAHKSGRNR